MNTFVCKNCKIEVTDRQRTRYCSGLCAYIFTKTARLPHHIEIYRQQYDRFLVRVKKWRAANIESIRANHRDRTRRRLASTKARMQYAKEQAEYRRQRKADPKRYAAYCEYQRTYQANYRSTHKKERREYDTLPRASRQTQEQP